MRLRRRGEGLSPRINDEAVDIPGGPVSDNPDRMILFSTRCRVSLASETKISGASTNST
jgi:hypothetical protein